MIFHTSPSGKTIVENIGPLDAEIILIGESPAAEEEKLGEPFVGKAGKILNRGLRGAGIDRAKCRIINLIPVRAPGDHFENHEAIDVEWAKDRFAAELARLENAKVFVALGAHPFEWLLGGKPPVAQRGEGKREGFISAWRGSVIPVSLEDGIPELPEDYLMHLPVYDAPTFAARDAVIIPTFHPAAILRQFTWHPWFNDDLTLAARIARDGLPKTKYRKWYFNDVAALERLAASGIDLLSVDTELTPEWIVGLATEDEVHVFGWREEFRPALTKILTSPKILKVAHNWLFDYAFFRKCLKIDVALPIYDTLGGAHVLNTALQKELSPHIATRFTTWPYHKWLVHVDPYVYNGIDAVVCYDAYWPQIEQLFKKKLYEVAKHDHKLLYVCMQMQAVGFKIDEAVRQEVELELRAKLDAAKNELQKLVEPVVEERLAAFEKPHLFRVLRKCWCCGGGTKQRLHCSKCSKFQLDPEISPITREIAVAAGFKTIKAMKEALPSCGPCSGSGKIVKKLDFNPDSPEQLADVIYRGLKIRPRKYKGTETVKAAQLDGIRHLHPIVDQAIHVSEINAEYETVARLRAGDDGLLHCETDPWGTGSGRTASKEGILEVGTNAQNLPKPARRFVVPRDGMTFLYPDFAQIEARAVAILSRDKNLIAAFTEPIDWPGNPRHGTIDSHTRIVQRMLAHGVEITRDQAKRLTYAVIYGARAKQLCVELNAEAFRKGSDLRLTEDQVQRMIDTFYRAFPDVKRWQQAVLDEVAESRKLRCPFTGREFTWLGKIYDKKTKSVKYEIAKEIWSRLPQNMAAWIMALGLIDMFYTGNVWGELLTALIHVHDAPLLEAPVERVEEAKGLALSLLSRYIWNMSFPAEMKQGTNWYEAS